MALPTFTDVVDSVNDVIATDINPIYAALRIIAPSVPASAWVHNHSLVGNMVLTDADLPIQSYNPTAARDVTFPALATTNHAFYIINHTGAFSLTCKTPAAATFATIPPNSGKLFISDGVNGWRAVADDFLALSDTPLTYVGQALKVARVNAGETAIEFSAAAGGDVATDAIWDAAGDLAVGTGANTAARLAKGTANQLFWMKADASTVEWAALASLQAYLFAFTENVDLTLAIPSADGKYSGFTEAGTAGAILAFGDLCYFAVADSKWELTDANAQATAFGKLGICVLAAAENAATKMLLLGKVRADTAFPALTIGAPVFVSTTAGDVQMAAPSGAADIIRIVGQAITADMLYFCPSPDFFEHA